MFHTSPRVFAHGVAVFAHGVAVLALCVGLLVVGVLNIGMAFGESSIAATMDNTQVSQQRSGIEHRSSADSSGAPETDSTVSRGPSIDPDESEQATQDKAQTKLVLGVITIGLLALVIFGRKKRNKHKVGKQR